MAESAVSTHIILNGELLRRDQAHISIFNQALFFSFGVYETIEVNAGICFHLEDHLDRLFRSASIIELPIQYGHSTIRSWVEQLMEVDEIRKSLLRIMVFGPSENNEDEDTLVYILPGRLPHYPIIFYTRGASAITFEGCRPLPQAKTFNTLVNYLALRRARRAGAHEAFLVNSENCLTEGSRSNLFVVAGDSLITPPAEQVLSGITRELVWKLAEARGIEVMERPIRKKELANVDEMFVTSTSMHIIPVIQVNQQRIGAGQIGPIVHALMRDFESYYARVMSREMVPTRMPG